MCYLKLTTLRTLLTFSSAPRISYIILQLPCQTQVLSDDCGHPCIQIFVFMIKKQCSSITPQKVIKHLVCHSNTKYGSMFFICIF